jgi:site-specific recombinase XerD
LNIILKPLEDAEKRLNQCQDMLDTRGIAATRHISEETVQKVTSVQHGVESNGNKLDRMGAALEAMNSKFSSWEKKGEQERAVHLDENKVRDVIQQMTSFFQMYHEMVTCPGSSALRYFYRYCHSRKSITQQGTELKVQKCRDT